MIVVTGASKGLGRAIADRLHSNGHEVHGIARTEILNAEFSSSVCDVTSPDALQAFAKKLKLEKKQLLGLVNAAGVASMNLAVTTTFKVTRNIIETNLLGSILTCQLLAPLMYRNKKGSIINFSTIAVPLGLKGESIYVASKAGVEGFTRSFAREAGDFGVRVNCIAPGPIKTDLIAGVSDASIDKIIQQQILRKMFSPSDISDLVELLFDPKADSISGQILNVGGF